MSKPEVSIERFRSACRDGAYDEIDASLSRHLEPLSQSHNGLFPIHDVLACKNARRRFESLKVLAAKGLPICSYSSFSNLAQKSAYQSYLLDSLPRVSQKVKRAGFNPLEYGFFELADGQGYERFCEVLALANVSEAIALVEDLRDMAMALEKSYLVDFCAAILPQLPKQYELISGLSFDEKERALSKFSKNLTVTQGMTYQPDLTLAKKLQPVRIVLPRGAAVAVLPSEASAAPARAAEVLSAGFAALNLAASRQNLADLLPEGEPSSYGEVDEDGIVGEWDEEGLAAAADDAYFAMLSAEAAVPVARSEVPESLRIKAEAFNAEAAKKSEGAAASASAAPSTPSTPSATNVFKVSFAPFEKGSSLNVGGVPILRPSLGSSSKGGR